MKRGRARGSRHSTLQKPLEHRRGFSGTGGGSLIGRRQIKTQVWRVPVHVQACVEVVLLDTRCQFGAPSTHSVNFKPLPPSISQFFWHSQFLKTLGGFTRNSEQCGIFSKSGRRNQNCVLMIFHHFRLSFSSFLGLVGHACGRRV